MSEAMTSQFPNYPLHLSASTPTIRSSREDKWNRIEQQHIAEAIYRSKKKFETKKELNLFKTLEDLKKKVSWNEPWKKVDDVNKFIACTMTASKVLGPLR